MKRAVMALMAIAFLAALAAPLVAQPSSVAPVLPSKSGMVSYIEGAVYLDAELIPDPLVAQFPFMKENGVLRTEEGRAEVIMNPGLIVHMGENASLRMITSRFIDTRVELVKGSAVVRLPEVLKDNSFTMVCKGAVVTIAKAGSYHFYADPAAVKVFDGLARVQIGDKEIDVPSGKMLDLSGGTASVEKFDKEATDALDRWSGNRGKLVAEANASAARDCETTGFVSSKDPCAGNWRWNRWYHLWTYIPIVAQWCDPRWGFCYYSPHGVRQAYYSPRPVYAPAPGFGLPSYPTASPTSGGYSGTAAASSSVSSAPSSGSGASAASSSAGTSVGAGAASGGGHGR